MTVGSIPRLLVTFALPLMIGNVFQQLYNTVDSIIVGNFVSKQALAAVGCTGPIINTLIGVFAGLSGGAGVVISQYYGAKDRERLSRSVQTTIVLTLIMCVILTGIGVAMTPLMLRLMDTPEDVMGAASEYLRIYFWGISGMLLYNIGAGILRAVGDSTHPLYFLIFSATTNTVLDYLFVKVFSFGIAGAAIATIVSQALSAVLVMRVLILSGEDYRVDPRALRLDGAILKRICEIGIPSSLQMGVTAVSNVFVQSYINRFESSCMAGWAAYNKLDAFAMLPLMGFSMAVTTFVGQNYGAGKLDRARKGPLHALWIGTLIMIAILTPMMVFAPTLVRWSSCSSPLCSSASCISSQSGISAAASYRSRWAIPRAGSCAARSSSSTTTALPASGRSAAQSRISCSTAEGRVQNRKTGKDHGLFRFFSWAGLLKGQLVIIVHQQIDAGAVAFQPQRLVIAVKKALVHRV